MLTGFQARAARAGVGITLSELSINTGISAATLKRMEKVGQFDFVSSNSKTIDKLLDFYRACGIEFTEENGLMINKP